MTKIPNSAANKKLAETMWQVPYADVFKRFNVLPFTFGEANLKKGLVSEEMVSLLGLKI